MDNETKGQFNDMREGGLNIQHLSDQALGAVMLALQNSLMHQTDIVPVLKGLKFVNHPTEGLVVTNPPILRPPENEDGA